MTRAHSIAGVRYDGRCRRYPPSVPDSDHDAQFPSVNAVVWCGEYAPANPQTISDAKVTLARFILMGDEAAAHALVDELKETAP